MTISNESTKKTKPTKEKEKKNETVAKEHRVSMLVIRSATHALRLQGACFYNTHQKSIFNENNKPFPLNTLTTRINIIIRACFEEERVISLKEMQCAVNIC